MLNRDNVAGYTSLESAVQSYVIHKATNHTSCTLDGPVLRIVDLIHVHYTCAKSIRLSVDILSTTAPRSCNSSCNNLGNLLELASASGGLQLVYSGHLPNRMAPSMKASTCWTSYRPSSFSSSSAMYILPEDTLKHRLLIWDTTLVPSCGTHSTAR